MGKLSLNKVDERVLYIFSHHFGWLIGPLEAVVTSEIAREGWCDGQAEVTLARPHFAVFAR
jgi:hypothetical protein